MCTDVLVDLRNNAICNAQTKPRDELELLHEGKTDKQGHRHHEEASRDTKAHAWFCRRNFAIPLVWPTQTAVEEQWLVDWRVTDPQLTFASSPFCIHTVSLLSLHRTCAMRNRSHALATTHTFTTLFPPEQMVTTNEKASTFRSQNACTFPLSLRDNISITEQTQTTFSHPVHMSVKMNACK